MAKGMYSEPAQCIDDCELVKTGVPVPLTLQFESTLGIIQVTISITIFFLHSLQMPCQSIFILFLIEVPTTFMVSLT